VVGEDAERDADGPGRPRPPQAARGRQFRLPRGCHARTGATAPGT
jgi:hypothetical protein